jgi:hypothetical protein
MVKIIKYNYVWVFVFVFGVYGKIGVVGVGVFCFVWWFVRCFVDIDIILVG